MGGGGLKPTLKVYKIYKGCKFCIDPMLKSNFFVTCSIYVKIQGGWLQLKKTLPEAQRTQGIASIT